MRPLFLRPLLIALLLLRCAFLSASELPVPVNVQLPLFQKIWKLDRSFTRHPSVIVAIVYQESYAESVQVKEQVSHWVDGKGRHLHTVAVAIDGTENVNALKSIEADVFYIAPLRAADIGAIAKIARSRHIRTNTGVPNYAEDGLGVAIDVRDDHPLIVINLPASEAEGASFPAQLLQLARLIGVTR